jgi:histidinol-phosphate aminotransferase
LHRRAVANAEGRERMEAALTERGLAHTRSQANFVYAAMPTAAAAIATMLSSRGVIIRAMSGNWIRVTIGSEKENLMFLSALDEVLGSVGERYDSEGSLGNGGSVGQNES